ncbi:MAG TPA: hypothetical protein VFY50_03515 [Candidatus Nitrosocosmicus sp.]|jgi:hypothetical protein|nr:hypothetical protein [Candidatus Nitrosocosmicus sp.]
MASNPTACALNFANKELDNVLLPVKTTSNNFFDLDIKCENSISIKTAENDKEK